MSDLMKYCPKTTRDFLRAIVRHDDALLTEIRAHISILGGQIGNADFVDIEIREGETLLCNVHRLNINKDHWTAKAEYLDAEHAWDADGVWFPVRDDHA